MKKRKSFFTFVDHHDFRFSAKCMRWGAANDKGNNANQDKEKTSLLQDIKDRGVMKVGVMGTYQPYNFLNENKEMDGFDVDIAKEVAKRLGVKAEFVAQEFSGMIPGLQAEKFDMVISQMTITDERKNKWIFQNRILQIM